MLRIVLRLVAPIGLVLAVLACGSPRPAPEPLGARPESAGLSGVGSCERDGDCIVVRGEVCSPCGGCRGEPERALPVAALESELGACAVDAAAPECPRCPMPPADWLERKAVCASGSCALEPPLGFH